MEDPNKQNTQTNFLKASMLSIAVLILWGYFFTPEKPVDLTDDVGKPDTGNVNVNSQPTPELAQVLKEPRTEIAEEEDSVPNKTITIKTPLYEARLDSKGAVATSWVLLSNDSKNADERKPLYGQGTIESEKKPLELISAEGLKRDKREAPFRLFTGDQGLDSFINERNYRVSISAENIELKGTDSKQVDFTLKKSDGTQVTKSFVFRANSYITDLSVKLTKDGKAVPNTKLLIGPSISDQGIERYTFYKVEPEGVSFVSGDSNRQYAASIIESGKDTGQVNVNGDVDWAGIGDTYFAMAAVPSQKTRGLEFRSEKFEVETEPFYDGIIAWVTRSQSTKTTKHLMTAYVPIVADGSTTRVYTGTKDYFILTDYNTRLSEAVGRPIDIEDFINYGWFGFIAKPLSVPILYCLRFLHSFTSNYGISIILFTLFFYSLLFPLRWYSSKSFKKAQKNAPKMKALQDKMKAMQKKGLPNDDPEMRKLQMEQLKMTKDAVPIGGCLPMLLQFPLIIALYITVSIYLGFRQETFLWLPDLSSGDPYHILEFAFAISMVLSFKFSPTAPAITPEQQMQQKMMMYIMPVMMLFIMWSAPSGLLLYWFTGNIIMFGQQMLINWMNKTEEPSDDSAMDAGKKPKLAT